MTTGLIIGGITGSILLGAYNQGAYNWWYNWEHITGGL